MQLRQRRTLSQLFNFLNQYLVANYWLCHKQVILRINFLHYFSLEINSDALVQPNVWPIFECHSISHPLMNDLMKDSLNRVSISLENWGRSISEHWVFHPAVRVCWWHNDKVKRFPDKWRQHLFCFRQIRRQLVHLLRNLRYLRWFSNDIDSVSQRLLLNPAHNNCY